jgi:hypothetical protein
MYEDLNEELMTNRASGDKIRFMLSVPDMDKRTILDKDNTMGMLRMQAFVHGNNLDKILP